MHLAEVCKDVGIFEEMGTKISANGQWPSFLNWTSGDVKVNQNETQDCLSLCHDD